MRILFIGGTRWVGHTMAVIAHSKGHEVTVFHRGQTPARLPESIVRVQGDRADDLPRLEGHWDTVVDTCGYLPRVVKRSVEWFADRTDRYLFISSLSAMNPGSVYGVDESGPVHAMDDPWTETFSMEHYGALKANCEELVLTAFGQRGLVIRPGLIIGPGDYSDRFTYWPVRFAQGRTVVAPDRKDQPVQVIDVRDLAAFGVHALEAGLSGIYHATGPHPPMRLEDCLCRIRAAVGSDAEIAWVPGSVLVKHQVEPWSDLPLVLGYSGEDDAMAAFSIKRALVDGLILRPVEESAVDSLAEFCETEGRKLKLGLTPEREAAILAECWD